MSQLSDFEFRPYGTEPRRLRSTLWLAGYVFVLLLSVALMASFLPLIPLGLGIIETNHTLAGVLLFGGVFLPVLGLYMFSRTQQQA